VLRLNRGNLDTEECQTMILDMYIFLQYCTYSN